MRSTQTSDLARVHSVSWHLMRRKPMRSRGSRVSQSHLGKQYQRLEAGHARLESMYQSIQNATFKVPA